MDEFINNLQLKSAIYAAILLIIGYFSAKYLSKLLTKRLKDYLSAQQSMLTSRFSYYGVLVLFGLMAAQQIGFNLNLLLGSAGVISVALAFASRTSVANIVSGLFLIVEKPFKVGDTILVDKWRGKVTAIDLMSTKLTTADNILIRIPNNTLISASISNFTHYSQRRLDLVLDVAYGTPLDTLRELLLDLVNNNPKILDKPEPIVRFGQFAESSLQVHLIVWIETSHFVSVKAELSEQIKVAFEQANIEIPFPQLTLHQATAK